MYYSLSRKAKVTAFLTSALLISVVLSVQQHKAQAGLLNILNRYLLIRIPLVARV